VSWFGVVVSVITDEPIIKKHSLTANSNAVLIPSFVIENFHMVTIGSPGVRNKLNTTVINNKNTIDFIPFTMNLNGTFDSLITLIRNTAATAYPATPLKTKREIINKIVVPSFTLGSNRCITESA
jgi:hypothetical protein